jgi:hypothetical protein
MNYEGSIAAAGWVCPARSSASHAPPARAPLPRPRPCASSAAPPGRLIRGPARAPHPRPRPCARRPPAPACKRHRWNIAAAPAASMEHRCCLPREVGRPGAAGGEAGGARAADGHTGRATAGADTAPGCRRDSLLTEGSGRDKRNLPRHQVIWPRRPAPGRHVRSGVLEVGPVKLVERFPVPGVRLGVVGRVVGHRESVAGGIELQGVVDSGAGKRVLE